MWRMTADVRKGLISLEEAAGILAKPCVCGVFNTKRAENLLSQCLASCITYGGSA